jgi:hypothetical protein
MKLVETYHKSELHYGILLFFFCLANRECWKTYISKWVAHVKENNMSRNISILHSHFGNFIPNHHFFQESDERFQLKTRLKREFVGMGSMESI